jgi:hypothetical protein
MASCATSSSLILVIHDNMIIQTNHIVLSMSLQTFLGPNDATISHTKMRKSRVKTEQEKEKKRQRRMNRRYLYYKRRCNRRTSWFKGRNPRHHQMNRRSTFLVVSDELQRRSSEDSSTGWSDIRLSGDTVGLSDTQFHSRQRRAKTKSSAPDDPTPWSRGSVGLFDGRVEANRDDFVTGYSAQDYLTHRPCIASELLCQRIFNGHVRWRQRLVAQDEPTPGKR